MGAIALFLWHLIFPIVWSKPTATIRRIRLGHSAKRQLRPWRNALAWRDPATVFRSTIPS